VGDILGRPFDGDGVFVEMDYLDRILGIDLELLRRTPEVMGIAGGAHKVAAIQGALRSGLLDTLITDETTAHALLDVDLQGR
jgi:DNA-binding transcriptional regulator LsrR (DeoR family)